MQQMMKCQYDLIRHTYNTISEMIINRLHESNILNPLTLLSLFDSYHV